MVAVLVLRSKPKPKPLLIDCWGPNSILVLCQQNARGYKRGAGPYSTYVKEEAVGDARPRQAGVLPALLLEVVHQLDLGLDHGPEPRVRHGARVDAELARDDALDARGDGGVDEGVLLARRRRGDDGDQGVLAGKRRLEGLGRAVVDLLDVHARRRCRGRAGPAEGCDVEPGLLQRLHEGHAQGAGGLLTWIWLAVLLAGQHHTIWGTYSNYRDILNGGHFRR